MTAAADAGSIALPPFRKIRDAEPLRKDLSFEAVSVTLSE